MRLRIQIGKQKLNPNWDFILTPANAWHIASTSNTTTMITVQWHDEHGSYTDTFANRGEYLDAYFGAPHSYVIDSVV